MLQTRYTNVKMKVEGEISTADIKGFFRRNWKCPLIYRQLTLLFAWSSGVLVCSVKVLLQSLCLVIVLLAGDGDNNNKGKWLSFTRVFGHRPTIQCYTVKTLFINKIFSKSSKN